MEGEFQKDKSGNHKVLWYPGSDIIAYLFCLIVLITMICKVSTQIKRIEKQITLLKGVQRGLQEFQLYFSIC